MPTSNEASFAFATTFSSEAATTRAPLTSPVAARSAFRRRAKARKGGESTVYRLEVATMTSCFSLATTAGKAWAIASFAFVDSGLPSTFPCELNPCSDVATSPSATTTATPQNTSVRRGREAHDRASLSVNPMVGVLLDGDRLRQIPWLVDVEAAQPRDPVGQQLQRNHGERCLEEVRSARHVDHIVGVVLDVLVAVGRDRDHVRAARPRLLDVRDDLVVDMDVRRDDDHGRPLVEQRDRPVLHLPGGVRLGRDVRDLLQLERALERDREADVAAEEEEERLLV